MKFNRYCFIFICSFFFCNTITAQLSCTNTWQTLEFDDFEHQNIDPAVVTSSSLSNGTPSTHGAYNGNYGIYLNVYNHIPPGYTLYDREFEVCNNTPLKLSMWTSTRYNGQQCNMTYNIYDENSNLLTTWTGDIPYASSQGWEYWTSDLFMTTGNTIRFQIINNVHGGVGNDYAMDDLLLEACATDYTLTYTTACDEATASLTGDSGGTFSFNPTTTDSAIINPTTGHITNGTPGETYPVQYTPSYLCAPITNQNITLLPSDDATFTVVEDCEGGTATIIGDAGGTFTFNPTPTDDATIDATTGQVTNGVSGASYSIEYTTNGPCPNTSTQILNVLQADDSSFYYTPSCYGGVATVTGLSGGVFNFNPTPTDGATIDTVTGEVTNGSYNTSYTVEYTTNGTCPDTSTQILNVLQADDSSFYYTPSCYGGLATVTGLSGGVFNFNPTPTDGATIDTVTGEVTNGSFNTSYTVEYTTNGTCPDTSTQILNTLPGDDSSFVLTPNCNGASATITGEPGGVFSFNPAPTDGATIDINTGLITLANPDTTYYVDYTSNSTCSTTSSQSVTTYPLPTINTPTPLIVCDGDVIDGITTMDLSVKNDEISENNPAYEITYYATQANADAATAPLPNPYTNYSSPNSQTIYIRVEDTTTGCFTTTTLDLIIEQAPVVTAEITSDAFADQHNITVTVTTISNLLGYEFSIDNGEWFTSTSNNNTYTFTDVSPGEHIINVRNNLGCEDASTTVMIMDYPLFFTPNGDGYNDTWNIYGIATQPDALIYIFDRYGKLLKQLSPTGLGWNGTYNGSPMPTSDYWFLVEYRDPNTNEQTSLGAHFTLKR